MVESLKKVEILAGEGKSIEVAEVPGKHEVRVRIACPGEWATIRLTQEQFQALADLRYSLEVK